MQRNKNMFKEIVAEWEICLAEWGDLGFINKIWPKNIYPNTTWYVFKYMF